MLRNLRTIRLARRMTQGFLATTTDLDQVYISALERGLRPSDQSHVTRIAKALGVTPRILLADAGVVVAPDGTVQEVTNAGGSNRVA